MKEVFDQGITPGQGVFADALSADILMHIEKRFLAVVGFDIWHLGKTKNFRIYQGASKLTPV